MPRREKEEPMPEATTQAWIAARLHIAARQIENAVKSSRLQDDTVLPMRLDFAAELVAVLDSAALALEEADISDRIAAVRKLGAENERLRAERLTPEERELLKRACLFMLGSLSAKRTGAADREAGAIMAVRAKIEAARDGGER